MTSSLHYCWLRSPTIKLLLLPHLRTLTGCLQDKHSPNFSKLAQASIWGPICTASLLLTTIILTQFWTLAPFASGSNSFNIVYFWWLSIPVECIHSECGAYFTNWAVHELILYLIFHLHPQILLRRRFSFCQVSKKILISWHAILISQVKSYCLDLSHLFWSTVITRGNVFWACHVSSIPIPYKNSQPF